MRISSSTSPCPTMRRATCSRKRDAAASNASGVAAVGRGGGEMDEGFSGRDDDDDS